MGLYLGIRAKMLLLLGGGVVLVLTAVSLMSLFGIPFTDIEGNYQNHRSEAIGNVKDDAQLKTGELQRWFEERIHSIRLFAEVVSSDAIGALFNNGIAQGVDRGALLAAMSHAPEYRKILVYAHSFLRGYAGANEMRIIDANTGLVIFSTIEANRGLDLSAHEGVRNARLPGVKEQVYFRKDHAASKPYLHIFYPDVQEAKGEDRSLLTVMLILDAEKQLSPLLHEGRGHEGSGEIILVDMERTILFPLKFPLPDQSSAQSLQYQLDTKAGELAAWGINGLIFDMDYRKIAVIAAVGHLRITPEYGIGVIVKIDEDEVMAFAQKNMGYSVLISATGLLLLLWLVSVLATRVTRPIIQLSQTAKRVMDGDLSQRAAIQSGDEVGGLAYAFNEMVETIEQWHDELDIKVRERTKQLFISEDLLAQAQHIAHIGSWTYDRSGQIRWSKEMFRIYGVDAAMFVPQLDAWLAQVWPEDRAQLQGWITDGLAGKQRGEIRFRNRRQDGALLWISCRSQLRVGHVTGADVVLNGTAQDITEEYLAQQELRHLRNYLSNVFDSMPSVLIGVDVEGMVTQWNHEAQRVSGLGAAAALGQPLSLAFPRLAMEMDRVRAAIASRTQQSDARRGRQEGGETHYEDMTVYPLIANGIEGAVIRVDDVTEKVRLEEMMVQSEKMLSVGGLAAGMAHEINNPLAGMMQTANVLANRLTQADMPANLSAATAAGTTMESIQAYMEARGILQMTVAIKESGERIAHIVDNMLSFARKGDAGASTHDLGELLDKTLELAATDYDLKKQYDFKAIKIVREYAQGLPPIPCEAAKIQQVLLNILRNGAQAMQVAGVECPTFILRLHRDTKQQQVVIEVEDNGPGMEEKTRRRVFEPFFTTKPVGVGTGLGLSVSYFIITENHGGQMSVTSAVGQGSCFTIHLPCHARGAIP